MAQRAPIMNSWEQEALQYNFDNGAQTTSNSSYGQSVAVAPPDYVHDSIIYPGIYAPSGYDMMSILVRVMNRSNPTVDIGAIDSSCALILCDLQQTDYPVVYINDAFTTLTGYEENDVLGRNCRFMQAPGGDVQKSSRRRYVDKDTIKKMRHAVEQNEEICVEVANFKKDGSRFINVLTMIPITWDSRHFRYSVGFQAEKP